MNSSESIPSTRELRRNRVLGLVVAVVGVVLVWTSATVVGRAGSRANAPTATSEQYVDGIVAMSPRQLAATFGTVPTASQQYVDGIVAMSPRQLAATFGTVPTASQQYVDGIVAMSPRQLAATFGRG